MPTKDVSALRMSKPGTERRACATILAKRFGIGAGIGFVVDFLGIGADHQIAVESGGNQNSFALSGGDLKDHRLDQMILVFVQNTYWPRRMKSDTHRCRPWQRSGH